MPNLRELPGWWENWTSSPPSDIFGPLYGGFSVQQAMVNTLKMWLPTYIEEVNRQLGAQVLFIPERYQYKPDYRPGTPLPKAAVLVTVSGTSKEPERLNSGTRSCWNAEVGLYNSGTQDWQETQALTYAYGLAARAAIAQHPALGGLAETTLWTGERYLEQEVSSTRVSGLALIDFEVTISNTMDVFGGPPSPQYAPTGGITGPYLYPTPNQPDATSVDVVVQNIAESPTP